MSIKKELTDLIAADKAKEAIEKLLAYAEATHKDDLHSSAILLSSRYNRNQKSFNSGTLTNEYYNLELNRITGALKSYIDAELEDSDEVTAFASDIKSKVDVSEIQNAGKSVFISYSHSELEYAKKVHTSLKELSVNVIIDYEDLPAGTDIKSFIENSIARASNTISIISSGSLLSSWISIEVIRTIHSENISNKKFIAAFIDDSFFQRSFTGEALRKIEAELTDIQKEIDERQRNKWSIDDLFSEQKRYTDLKHHLPTIVQRLKESYSVDIRDSVYDDGIQKIYEALIQ